MKLFTETRLRVALALAGALLVFNLLSFAFGQAPARMLAAAFHGTWGTAYGVGQVLFKATPLLLTGLAFQVALRAGLFRSRPATLQLVVAFETRVRRRP